MREQGPAEIAYEKYIDELFEMTGYNSVTAYHLSVCSLLGYHYRMERFDESGRQFFLNKAAMELGDSIGYMTQHINKKHCE